MKNATDDALTNYLTSIKIRQSHSLVDKRLTLGYTAAVIAAMTFYADWKFGFEKLKLSIALAVVVFSILNTAFTLWLWKVEGDEVFRGVPSGQTRLVSSCLPNCT